MTKLAELFEASSSVEDYVEAYRQRLSTLLGQIDLTAVGRVAELVETCWSRDATVFFIGNGGSAATASHFVNDLVPNSLVEGKRGIRAFALTDNIASLTAVANDTDYSNIFSHQLRAVLRDGDLVVALSVSGNSENINKAVLFAKDEGAMTVGVTGFDGGKLSTLVDVSVHIPSTRDEYGPIEDIFSILGHMISGYLTMKRGRMLAH